MRFVAIALLMMSVTFVCSATQENPQERIVELEEENQRLRGELAELRLAMAQLRREMDTDEDLEPGEDTSDQQTDDAAVEAGGEDVRTFGSADEIYRSIPENLRPGRDGWSRVETQDVSNWLSENVPGSSYESRLEVHQVQISYDTIAKDWRVSIHFKYRDMRFMSWGMEERVGMVVLRGDGDFAERAEGLREGARVAVTGEIISTSWGGGCYTSRGGIMASNVLRSPTSRH